MSTPSRLELIKKSAKKMTAAKSAYDREINRTLKYLESPVDAAADLPDCTVYPTTLAGIAAVRDCCSIFDF